MKTKSLFRAFVLMAALLPMATLSYGQFTGPGSTEKMYTVQEIQDRATELDRKDVKVKVQGFVVKQIKGDKYEFRDKTGSIRVEIDKDKMPARSFDENTELILIAEVEKDLFQSVKLEVEKLEFAM